MQQADVEATENSDAMNKTKEAIQWYSARVLAGGCFLAIKELSMHQYSKQAVFNQSTYEPRRIKHYQYQYINKDKNKLIIII